MNRALILALAGFAWVAAAGAQPPNSDPSSGPHDPNPPANAPDLRLPPPCAPAAHLAATGGIMSPAAATATPSTGRTMPVDGDGKTQCSANTPPQAAELPGLAPGVQ